MVATAWNYDPNNIYKRKTPGLVSAMNGTGRAFAPTPTLPNNYGFNDLAGYEEARNKQFGQEASTDILKSRDELASTLGDYSKNFFQQQNPAILEDLNSRGLLTSPSEVAKAETKALKEIGLSNENTLSSYDEAALSARLQSGQNALDAGNNIRQSGLESQIQGNQSNNEMNLAKDLAKQNSRNQLTNSLIGVGGNIVAGGLGSGGFLTNLFKSRAPSAIPSAVPSSVPSAPGAWGQEVEGAPATTAAGGTATASPFTPGVGSVASAGLGAMLLSRAAEKKGGTAAGIVANPIGYELNKAKDLLTNPKQTLSSVGSNISHALTGGGKTANGNAIADTARSIESQTEQINDLAQSDPQQADAILANIKKMVESSASQGSAWASAINPFWQKIQDQGLVKAVNGQWVSGITGQAV